MSNLFWADQLGSYGAQSSLLQPFLHTWSLAIEEQFYLLFPLVLLGLFKIGTKMRSGSESLPWPLSAL
ncbi:hypothetical protein C8024_14125 [Sphingopyxis sp. BSNA05]|nr:hypothetical protein [Sphingopyxis sp. BSNA05]